MTKWRSLLHRLAHFGHWQRGEIVSNWSGDTLWVAFRCSTCGKVTDADVTSTTRQGHAAAYSAEAGQTPPLTWKN